APGNYVLNIDNKPIASGTAADWAAGVKMQRGPEFDQVEQLRKAIRAKNRLYFHRWRPQNETYLFGFRKHEQGKNAKEIVEFDPLIARGEMEIAKLRVPVTHHSQLVPESKQKQNLDKIPNPDPELERKSFQVAKGFEVNLFAADPLLAKPIQMNF